ncbi:hypothetical protein NPIL_482991 [Nephila pilipes]|uniref:Uncharacterized protein n=1 Tax=Nephila pilipes TaxID=299642 RepID=A0A8X6QCN7_NEPPI|nr:hypothetical protein NPIL_482991 [Nephila pilipes]
MNLCNHQYEKDTSTDFSQSLLTYHAVGFKKMHLFTFHTTSNMLCRPSIGTSQRDIANKAVPNRDKTSPITLTVIHVQTNGRVHRLHARVVTCNQQLKGASIRVCCTPAR